MAQVPNEKLPGRTHIWHSQLLVANQSSKTIAYHRGGYGIHWPDIDEDLSTEGLLRGAPAPKSQFIEAK